MFHVKRSFFDLGYDRNTSTYVRSSFRRAKHSNVPLKARIVSAEASTIPESHFRSTKFSQTLHKYSYFYCKLCNRKKKLYFKSCVVVDVSRETLLCNVIYFIWILLLEMINKIISKINVDFYRYDNSNII